MNQSQTAPITRTQRAEQVLNFLILVGLSPAVMTSMISVGHWVTSFLVCWQHCAPVRITEPLAYGAPLYSATALVALIAGLALAARRRSLLKALSLLPFVLFLGRDWIDADFDALYHALTVPSPSPEADPVPIRVAHFYLGNLIYNISTSVVFISFIVTRDHFIRTRFFFAFLVFLGAMWWIEPVFGSKEFLFFAASALAIRMVFLFLRTNLEMFGRLGTVRTLTLLGKTLVLMLPIWLLVGLGLWVQSIAASAVQEAAYERQPLCGYQVLLKAALPRVHKTQADEDLYHETLADEFADTKACKAPEGLTDQDATDEPNKPNTDDRNKRKERALIRFPNLLPGFKANGFPCGDPVPDPAAAAEAPPDIERDLCYHAEYRLAGAEYDLRKAINNAASANEAGAAGARKAARDTIHALIPPVQIWRERECKGWDWLPCEFKQWITWMVDSAVNGAITRLRNAIISDVLGFIDRAETGADGKITGLDAYVSDVVSRMRAATHSIITNAFDFFGVVDHVLLVILILAILKSLAFVFARICFSSDDKEAAIIFCEPDETFPTGKLSVKGKRYTLEGSGLVYFNRRAQMEGIAPSLAFPPPQPFACLFSRLAGRTYLLNKARLGDGRQAVFKTGDVREFVEWDLAKGEQVIFHFSDFVAMDESVRLSTYVSFHIATLLTGRFLFRVACGPGRLVLRPEGATEVIDQGDAALSKPVHRFVAWHRAARFKIEAEQSFLDIYFSSVHMRKLPKDLVVFVAEKGDRTSLATGASRFLKTFILPI